MPTDTVASTACSCVPQGQRSSCKTSPAMHSMASRLGTSFIKTMNSSSWVRATRSVARKTAGSTCVVCAMTASPASRPNMLLMLSSVSWSTRSSAWERSGRNGPEDRPPDRDGFVGVEACCGKDGNRRHRSSPLRRGDAERSLQGSVVHNRQKAARGDEEHALLLPFGAPNRTAVARSQMTPFKFEAPPIRSNLNAV